MPKRHFKAVAAGIPGQLLADLGDLRLQGLNESGKYAAQAVFRELLLDLVEHGSRSWGRNLRFVHNKGFFRRWLERMLKSGGGHLQDPPIVGIGFQSPKVFRPVEARTQPEALPVGPHRLAENHVGGGLTASPAVQAQGASGVQL